MKRIYTKTGDRGTTGIWGGERVDKDDVRIEAVGTLDELNALIGIVRSEWSEQDERQPQLKRIQTDLMALMSLVGTPSHLREQNRNQLSENAVSDCEQWMDRMMEQMQDNGYFLLPGGNRAAAFLHLARTVARRAERRVQTLHKIDTVPNEIKQYINRLSDLFFVMARYELQRNDHSEEKWKLFAYKRKSEDKA